MHSLSSELKGVISRRLDLAGPREVLAIASALCAKEISADELELEELASAATAASRFTKIGADGEALPAAATEWEAVLDTRTGLMWSVETKHVTNWKKAEAAAADIKAAGFADWRLPTVEELFLLADRSRVSPAIDTEYFPDCPSDWFWTSTVYAPSPGVCAWGVYFYVGNAYWGDHGLHGFVRAVRAGKFL